MRFDVLIKHKYDIILLSLFMLIVLIFYTIFGSQVSEIQSEINQDIQTQKIHDKLIVSSVYS